MFFEIFYYIKYILKFAYFTKVVMCKSYVWEPFVL